MQTLQHVQQVSQQTEVLHEPQQEAVLSPQQQTRLLHLWLSCMLISPTCKAACVSKPHFPTDLCDKAPHAALTVSCSLQYCNHSISTARKARARATVPEGLDGTLAHTDARVLQRKTGGKAHISCLLPVATKSDACYFASSATCPHKSNLQHLGNATHWLWCITSHQCTAISTTSEKLSHGMPAPGHQSTLQPKQGWCL